MYILATTRTGQEFATADAINSMMHRPDPDGDLRPAGALAVVPRRIIIAPGKDGKRATYEYKPFLPNYVFLAMDELLWSRIISRNKATILRDDRHRTIQPPRHQDDILPRTWASFQTFAARAEIEAQRQIDTFEAGQRVTRYSKGDKLRIIGDMMDGQLHGLWARFLRMENGRAVVEPEGMTMLGKQITVRLEPGQIAAE